jgi:hypothetical protein
VALETGAFMSFPVTDYLLKHAGPFDVPECGHKGRATFKNDEIADQFIKLFLAEYPPAGYGTTITKDEIAPWQVVTVSWSIGHAD